MINEANRSFDGTPPACLAPRFRKKRFNPPEAVEYLLEVHGVTIATATLSKFRSVGGGPKFQRFGRSILYQRVALDAWAIAKLGEPRRSTSGK